MTKKKFLTPKARYIELDLADIVCVSNEPKADVVNETYERVEPSTTNMWYNN